MIFAVVTRQSDRPYHTLTTGGQYEPDGKLWPDAAACTSSPGPDAALDFSTGTDRRKATDAATACLVRNKTLHFSRRAYRTFPHDAFPFIVSEKWLDLAVTRSRTGAGSVSVDAVTFRSQSVSLECFAS